MIFPDTPRGLNCPAGKNHDAGRRLHAAPAPGHTTPTPGQILRPTVPGSEERSSSP